MELQFVGDIKAVRVGDKFKAYGKLQSRRTGNYVEVDTEIDIPSLLAEARSVYNAARSYLSTLGKEIEALPTDATIEGMGRAVSLATAQARRAKGKSLNSGELALLREHEQSRQQSRQLSQSSQRQQMQSQRQLSSAQKSLADEKKKQIAQAKMRSEAARRMSERRVERKGYEDKLAELKKQIDDSAADATRQAELQAVAAKYEAQMAAMDDATAQMQVQYESQMAQIQSMPAAQVAELPQLADIAAKVDALVASQSEAQETIEGLGGKWSFFKNVAKKFKKALAVVFRSKIVKGLVKAAATVYGGPAGAKLADAAMKAAGGKKASKVKVAGLGCTVENARVWIRLLESAKQGNENSTKVLNRIKVMARLKHPQATKTFWLLRDIEKVLPEVKAKLASGEPDLTEDPTTSSEEPKAVPDAMVGLQMLGGAESAMPVQVRCMGLDPDTLSWHQIPFQMAMGKKKPIHRKRPQRRRPTQRPVARPTPTPNVQNRPGTVPAQTPSPASPGGYAQPFDPYYGQPSGSQAGYPPGYGPYDQSGYDPYAAQYPQPPYADPYAQAYAQPPYADPYAQPAYDPYANAYTNAPQSYGDYSAAEVQPGFDPYNPASYGY